MTESTQTGCATPVSRGLLLRMTVATEGGMLAAAVVLCLLWGNGFWHTAHLGLQDLAIGAGSGLLMLLSALVMLESEFWIAVQIRRDVERLIGIFDRATVLDLFLISLLAGLGEEALFRGFLQPVATGYLGVTAAVVVVSLIFGAVHCISLAYVVFAAVLGVAFGVLQAWSGNILVAVVAHATYDFAALLYGVRFRRFTGGD